MAFEISKFRTEIDNGGILRTNRFIVQFPNAGNSKDMLSLRCESVQWPGVSFMTMDAPPRAGYGATELIPYAPIFEDVTLSFIVDKDAKAHKFFFDWMNKIVNLQSEGQTNFKGSGTKKPAYEVGYKKDYSSDIYITMYKETGSSEDQKHRVMTATLYGAFPKALQSFELNWGSENEVLRLNVQFAYTDYFIQYHSG